jgi:protocatechuate 3,4-dioxygenase beta subunit
MDEKITNADLSLRPGLTLSVHVRDTNGNPIAGAAGTLTVDPEAAGWNFAPIRAAADGQGMIEIKALPQGRYYTATIASRGFGSVQVEAPDAETHTPRFAFRDAVLPLADLEVAGQVLDTAGKPAPQARVTLTGGQPYKTDNTDADGRFAFYGLCNGTSSIYVENRSTNFQMEGQAAARAGDTNVVIRLHDVTENPRFPPAPVANRPNPARPAAVVVNGPMVTNYGRVLNSSGAPVSGVVLAIAPNNGMQPKATNDANGNFTIVWRIWNFGGMRTRRFIYVRDLERNLSASHEVDETTTNLELRLEPGLPLSVKLLDANGEPIRTATASMSIFTGTTFLPFDLGSQFTGRADENGLIEIQTLPRGLRYSLAINAKGYGFTNIEAQFADTQTNVLDFPAIMLHRTDRSLAGLVLGLDGKPVPEALVSLNGAGQRNTSTTTDAGGNFIFNSLVEGSVRLQANPPLLNTNIHRIGAALAEVGETNVVIRIGVDGGPQLEADALARRGVTNAAVRPATNAPTAAPQGPTMTTLVTALDPSGAPAAGVTLRLFPQGAVTNPDGDANGKTTISWHPKTYPTPLLVGRDLEHNQAAFLILDQMSTNVSLRLQEGFTLCGSVQDDKGAALGTATMALNIVRPGMGVSLQTVKVDQHGDFTISALPKGQDYTITASAPGFFASSNFLVQADQTQTARLQLLPIRIKGGDFPLEGRVVAPDGKPVAGAIVRAAGTGQPNGTASTDDNGHFLLRANEGLLRITASVLRNHPGGVFNPGTIEAHAGDTNLVVRLTALNSGGAAAPRAGAPSPASTPPLGPCQRKRSAQIAGRPLNDS